MKAFQIVIAVDSFKGSASSIQAENWLEAGIRKVLPDSRISKIPVADGGEGTVAALTTALNGRLVEEKVEGPLGEEISATFGMLEDTTAVIEMAEASGITLIQQDGEDVLHASTYGVGQLMLAAVREGAKVIYLGLGGSATNDGGAGMAQALGISFKDSAGREIPRGAIGLKDVVSIDASKKNPALEEVSIKILSDVTNPLTGANGATAVYGPQKGITPESVEEVDSWLKNYGEVIQAELGVSIADQPGAGAAGGLGAGLLAFFHTEMYQGIEHILELLAVEEKIRNASLVITGEGKMDAQSINGKAPIGIARLAKKYGVPVIAVVGSRDNDLAPVYAEGIDLVLSVINRPMTLSEAIGEVEENLITAGETAIRAFLLKER